MSCWQTWTLFPKATDNFLQLPKTIAFFMDMYYPMDEKFFVLLYDKSSDVDNVK